MNEWKDEYGMLSYCWFSQQMQLICPHVSMYSTAGLLQSERYDERVHAVFVHSQTLNCTLLPTPC
jgi:hypothetical protein